MTCPKCGSENVQVQMASETKLKTKHHGIFYWVCCLWMIDLMLWIFFTLPKLLIAIFKPKKYKTKTIHKSMCVCQNCGRHWKA